MFSKAIRPWGLLLVLLAAVFLTGCTGNDKPLLASPKVGDLYAAELTHFTSFADDEDKGVDEGFGLLKVTGVSDREIKVVTTSWYLETKRGVLKELYRDPASQQWDLMDVITIQRADLAGLHEAGQIFDVRRTDG